MSTQELGALLRRRRRCDRPSSLPWAGSAWEATALPRGTPGGGGSCEREDRLEDWEAAQIRVAPYPKLQKQRFPESRATDKGILQASREKPGKQQRSPASPAPRGGASGWLLRSRGPSPTFQRRPISPEAAGEFGITNPDPRQFPPQAGMIFDTRWLLISAEKGPSPVDNFPQTLRIQTLGDSGCGCRRHNENRAVYKPAGRGISPGTKLTSTLILDFPASRTVKRRPECNFLGW
ncbi:uncharacterized protein AAES06_015562 [Glossophaga mutica]